LDKEKIILFGTSWGSALYLKISSKRPELYYAYVGYAQIVNSSIDFDFYNKIYKMAEHKNDKNAVDILNTICKPPYDSAKKVGQLFRILKNMKE
jgi:pimeloyl-ACP methyl ester carboxylesterase